MSGKPQTMEQQGRYQQIKRSTIRAALHRHVGTLELARKTKKQEHAAIITEDSHHLKRDKTSATDRGRGEVST